LEESPNLKNAAIEGLKKFVDLVPSEAECLPFLSCWLLIDSAPARRQGAYTALEQLIYREGTTDFKIIKEFLNQRILNSHGYPQQQAALGEFLELIETLDLDKK
jgi:hypothetical protein